MSDEQQRAKTQAFVLSDGSVVERDALMRYATKQQEEGESDKLEPDPWEGDYGESGLREPTYNMRALARLMQRNTYHRGAIATISFDVVGHGWRLEAAVPEGQEASEEQHKLAKAWLEQPHPEQELWELVQKAQTDYEATGNCYLELVRPTGSREGIAGLEHLPAPDMRRHKDGHKYAMKRGTRTVWFRRAGYDRDVDKRDGSEHAPGTLDAQHLAHDVIHLANYEPLDDYYGLPDSFGSLGAMVADWERLEFNLDFFENHAVPRYAVTVIGAELDADTRKEIRQFFNTEIKENPHSTLLLTIDSPPGTRMDDAEVIWEPLDTEVRDASFRLYRQDNRNEVLSSHRVPPYRVGIAEVGSLGENVAAETTKVYQQSVLTPRQMMWQTRLTRHVLQYGLEVTDWRLVLQSIDTERVDARVERVAKLFDKAAATPNELREAAGKEPSDKDGMNDYYLEGTPLEAVLAGQPAADEAQQAAVQSVSDLHAELVQVVKDDAGEETG